jgi:hypothetical protein
LTLITFIIMIKSFIISATALMSFVVVAQETPKIWEDKFKQLGPELATPNDQRTASGAPGHEYWQQRADYNMKIRLDDEKQRIDGDETITYYNNSPDALTYIWLQLDQNIFDPNSDSRLIEQSKLEDKLSFNQLNEITQYYDGGFKIQSVKDAAGANLKYTVNKTMMRIDLPKPLASGQKFVFSMKWWFNITDRIKYGGRSGWEYFEEDKNYLYTIAQFFPRMVVYSDNQGWQHKQFLGAGEFTLNFGNYTVAITVPSDHIVGATGVLQNPKEVLTAEQQKRLSQAANATEPIMIVTQDEAIENEKEKSTSEKTWIFKAENVRDFAFSTSRKFIWDAMGVQLEKHKPMAMSLYPKEGNPLWEQYSTKVIAQTLKTYSHFTVEYSYPVAYSVHSKWIGMEYPMMCFNGGRPEPDGTYSEGTKNGMISVIIHEVGHNFFPMIINSDERQWTWMDEGLNTFVQYLTEKEFDRNYPSWRGPARNIVEYMKADKSKMSPIMTNSESIYQFGNNAYGKPATALNILRETVMGRELFDYAFKEYSRRWAFKHPTPDDFFRTMEDASGVDLDWFWRGWFYGTEHCDMAIEDVKWMQVDTQNPEVENALKKKEKEGKPKDISKVRDSEAGWKTAVELDPELSDFYTKYDPLAVTVFDREDYDNYISKLSEEEKKLVNSGKNLYQVTVENVGGLIMPLIFELKYVDGTSETIHIPAEIWKMNEKKVNKVFITEKEVSEILLDPLLETADCELENNYWPQRFVPSRLELFKEQQRGGGGAENPMQKAKKAEGKK